MTTKKKPTKKKPTKTLKLSGRMITIPLNEKGEAIAEPLNEVIGKRRPPTLREPDPLTWYCETNEPFTPENEGEPTTMFFVKAQTIDEAFAKAKRAIAGHLIALTAVSLTEE